MSTCGHLCPLTYGRNRPVSGGNVKPTSGLEPLTPSLRGKGCTAWIAHDCRRLSARGARRGPCAVHYVEPLHAARLMPHGIGQ